MERKVPIDPFSYGKLDILTTLIQLGTAVAGIILALNGNTAGLLALGSLAGWAKGTLVGDFLSNVARDLSNKDSGSSAKPKGRKGAANLYVLFILVFVVFGTILFHGCGMSQQFLIDSRQAIAAEAGDYLTGCQQVTVAPAFSLDWNENVTYGGGVFAGCAENGRIVEFRCEAYQDDQTGKTRMKCAPLSVWERTSEKEITSSP